MEIPVETLTENCRQEVPKSVPAVRIHFAPVSAQRSFFTGTPSKRPRIRRVLSLGIPLLIYIALSAAYFAKVGSWTQWYFGWGEDPVIFIWFLHWWPFAIGHGLNPFESNYVWFPQGFNFAWYTSVPFAALLSLPVTLLGGAVLSFNLLSLLAPALAAWTAFLLARDLTRDWAAALVGGYLFGFSSYEFGQMLCHLHLDLIFLVPVVVLLCVRRARGRLGRGGFIAGLAVVLLAQLGFSTEVLATLCVFGAITWMVFLLCAPAADRHGLWRLAIDILTAAAVAIVLASPFLFYLVKGLPDVPPAITSPTFYSADLLNYVIPTIVSRFGRTVFASFAGHFTGNLSEQGAYLGLPLIFLVALYFRDQIGRPYARALLIATCLLAVLSLGPWLQVDGFKIKVPLPWWVALRLPLIHDALPTRFTMYVTLCAAVAAALWLAEAKTGSWRLWRFALAGLACLFLVPNTSLYRWSRWPTQPFFTPQHVRQALGPMPNVIILPFFQSGPGMAWQLEAGLRFTQSGGYLGYTPWGEYSWGGILSDLSNGTAGPDFGHDLAAFCDTHRVSFILIGPDTPGPLVTAIAAQQWPQYRDRGIQVVRVPDPSTLKYKYIEGDYWTSPAAF